MDDMGSGGENIMLSYEELAEQNEQLVADMSQCMEEKDLFRRANDRWEAVFDALADLVIVVDRALNVVYVNRTAAEAMNCRKEQLTGKKYYEIIYGQDHPTADCPLVCAQKTLKTEWKEISESRLGGIFLFSASLIIGRSGKHQGFCLTLRDITGLRRKEREAQQATTLDAIGTLSGVIAHEWNNLLTGLQGSVSLVMEEVKAHRSVTEKLQRMEKYIERGQELTKQLLGFSEGNKYEVEPTDLNRLVEKTCERFGASRNDVRVVPRLQEGVWTSDVDAGQIEQVLSHLCTNAVQAMPQGGELNIQTDNVTFDQNYADFFGVPTGRYVKITVTDTGEGMDYEAQEMVFDPFYTTRPQGTGLGLAFSQKIVTNHGGLINVYSEKGHGTSFNIYLPASEGDEKTVKSPGDADAVMRGSETILLVDDEKLILDVGGEMLREMGYKVIPAHGGVAAVETYGTKKDEIDLVILDMIMPDLGGSETYDRLRETNPDVKVLLASGYSITSQVTEILDRGFNGFIQKPFNMSRLSKKLREILESNG